MKNTLKEISLTLQGTALRPTGSGLFPAKVPPKGEMTQFFEHSLALTTYNLQLTTYNSQLTAHNSQLTAHNSQLTAHNSQLTCMLEALITSKTRIKLLVKFFLKAESTGYLRGLSEEFNESTNAVRIELNRFEEAGLLSASNEGNRKIFKANTRHPLFPDIQSIVRKYLGMDEIIDHVIHQLGDPIALYLIGDIANGIDSPDLSLIIVGNDIHLDFLETLVTKAQKLITKTIKYAVFTPQEFSLHLPYLDQEKLLQVWKSEQ